MNKTLVNKSDQVIAYHSGTAGTAGTQITTHIPCFITFNVLLVATNTYTRNNQRLPQSVVKVMIMTSTTGLACNQTINKNEGLVFCKIFKFLKLKFLKLHFAIGYFK